MSIIGCANCGGTHYGSNECPYLEKNMGEPCVVCKERTSYCCSDCAIDGTGKVYVCIAEACRSEHEKKHRLTAAKSGVGITDEMVEAAAIAMWNVWQASDACRDDCKGISWSTMLANVGNNRAADAYVRVGRDEARAAITAAIGKMEGWRPIETAPKDGTRVLLLLKNPIPNERDDLSRWDGIPFVGRHNGYDTAKHDFDMGWQFAAPVGQGGFPDEWMVGWQIIAPPPTSDGGRE